MTIREIGNQVLDFDPSTIDVSSWMETAKTIGAVALLWVAGLVGVCVVAYWLEATKMGQAVRAAVWDDPYKDRSHRK